MKIVFQYNRLVVSILVVASLLLINGLFSPVLALGQERLFVGQKNIDKIGGQARNKLESLKNINKVKEIQRDYVPGEVLVKFKKDKINLKQNSGEIKAINFASNKNLEKKEHLKRNNTSILKIKGTESVEEMIRELRKDPNVEYAQPNFQYYPRSISSDDTFKINLWGLDNEGQQVNGISGLNDADIDSPESWEISEGADNEVIVAIIDTGVAYNHSDLADNMWDGSDCVDENGDFLGNCNYGYDYAGNDRTPLPTDSSHGTHIAGTIGAVKNNNKGIIGVAPNVEIMALKSNLTTSEIVKAISFAEYNDAKVINASWGGNYFDSIMYDVVESFSGLFIAAAGNDMVDNDNYLHSYPSDYDLDNIISVAATDQNDNLASFSNYGTTSVDVGAPGTSIYSTIADSVAFFEYFGNVTIPNIPNGWSKGGADNNFGTYNVGGGLGNVLYGDLSYPYSPLSDTFVDSLEISLGDAEGASMEFLVSCDTEYDTVYWTDYMTLEISSDGINFDEQFRFDEYYIEGFYGDISSLGNNIFTLSNINIPTQYLTNNFKFRFRWITNDIDNNYYGCFVDGIEIVKYSNGLDEQYGFKQGTSMAAPHVAGLAGLIWGYNAGLSYSEVKTIILDTGDSLPSLSGKTVTGKRINAFNALQFLSPSSYTISGVINYYDGVKNIKDAIVILEDDQNNQLATTVTNIDGYYEFTEVAEGGNYIVRIENDDEHSLAGVNVVDLIKIKKHTLLTEEFDNIYKFIASDVNDSGTVSVMDLIKIKKYTLLTEIIPATSWKFYSSEAELTTENYLTVGLNREFNNLIEDMTNQNFIGIKMGDANNSWNNN